MKVYFAAVGGSVIHQLAIALKKKSYRVTGSSDEIFEPARSNLPQAGFSIVNSWNPSLIVSDFGCCDTRHACQSRQSRAAPAMARWKNYSNRGLIVKSSGNFDGADILTFAKQVTGLILNK